MASKPRQSFSGSRASELLKSKESPPVPDSTTEPAPRPAQRFQEGDEVFLQTETGQQVLGAVGEVRGQTCLIQFGDGTTEIAPFKRLKKLFGDPEEEEPPPIKKAAESSPSRPQQTCGSCGAYRRISAKKAKLYQEDSRQFECRRCMKLNLSQTSPISVLESFMSQASNSLKGKLPPDVSITPMGSPTSLSAFSLPSTCSPNALKSKTPSLNAPVSIPRHIQFSVVPAKQHSNTCFNCDLPIQPYDRVHCKMCEMPCHLGCLSILKPPPLSGDTMFWDVLCSTCGNQNSNEKVKVFSARRNINSWADIAWLLISCLSVTNGHRMFDLDSEMIPFLELNIERLHLPKMYKSANSETRHKFILNALSTSRLKFQNGREVKKKGTLWGMRQEHYMDHKKIITSIASELGLKKKVKPEVTKQPLLNTGNFTGGFPSTQKQPSPDLLRFIVSTKNEKQDSPPKVDENESDSTSKSDATLSSYDPEAIKKEPDVTLVELSKHEKNFGCGSSSSSTTSTNASEKNLKIDSEGYETSRSSSSKTSSSITSEKNQPLVNSQDLALPLNIRKRKASESNAMEDISRITNSSVTKRARKRVRNEILDTIQMPENVARKSGCPLGVSLDSSGDEDVDENVTHESPKQRSKRRNTFAEPYTFKRVPAPTTFVKETEGNKEKGKTARKGSKVQQNNLGNEEEHPSKTPGPRLRRRGPGRPAGTNSKPSAPFKRVEGSQSRKSLRPNNAVKSVARNVQNGDVPVVSRRVGTFNSISERRPVPIVIEDTSALSTIAESLYDAALYGNYRMECLPRYPQTEAEKRLETLKVFSHFRTEKENEIASCLLSRSATETRSQTRRKSELFVGAQKRDLNDFDSYEVIGKRVDPDGTTRYQVIWKHQNYYSDEFEDLHDEDEKVEEGDGVSGPFASLKLFGNGGSTKPVMSEVNRNQELEAIEEEMND